jgi:hypothetical protein
MPSVRGGTSALFIGNGEKFLDSSYPYRQVGANTLYGCRKSLRPLLQTSCGTILVVLSELRERSCGFGGW